MKNGGSKSVGMWMGFGVAIGIAIGAALGNPAYGIGIGVALGAGIGMLRRKKNPPKDDSARGDSPKADGTV